MASEQEEVPAIMIERSRGWWMARADREPDGAMGVASSMFSPTKDEDRQLLELLEKHQSMQCRIYGHPIFWGDIAWNNGCTAAGTEHCTIEIECTSCYQEVAMVRSWYPSIDDPADVLHVLKEDWK